jgi:hypothetical protein
MRMGWEKSEEAPTVARIRGRFNPDQEDETHKVAKISRYAAFADLHANMLGSGGCGH